MNEAERAELLESIYNGSGTIGSSIPEEVTIDGETVPLREFYFEVADRDDLGEEERERVEAVLSYLRRERLAMVQRIKNREVDYETGTSLVPMIRDLDRAINAFESLDAPSYAEQVRRHRVESASELVDLMREFGKL